MRDFTIKKYKQIIDSLVTGDFRFYNINDSLNKDGLFNTEKIAIIRHDIDTKHDLKIALEMAKYEAINNVSASYYFRTIPDVYDKTTIKEIYNMGHEIGYHYEVLALTDGDMKKGIELFKDDLERLRSVTPIKTICQHGGTLGKYSSTSVFGLIKSGFALMTGKLNLNYYPSIRLWDEYKLTEFDLTGDAYLSLDFKKIKYFSDTGLSWDSHGTRIVDNVDEGDNVNITAHSTDDLIQLIDKGKVTKLNLLVHPANWNDKYFDWLKWRTLQNIRNMSKKLLKKKR